MDLKPGDKLGPYTIVTQIGAGGMGQVWKARDTRLDRIVAIKTSAAQFSDRFEREARAVAALNHPNICTLYDVGPDYLVMEFIEGTPPRGPLPPAEAVRIALGIAAGLEAAHGKGITHRDLKPANVLITGSGVKLLDFGLASTTEARNVHEMETAFLSTIPGTLLGTAGYMSPEQAQGKPADARSDIFSFGLVLYELLSGRRAFAGGSAIELIAAVLHKEPEPLNAQPKLSEIVMRCLRKAPESRFQTMSEIRAALEAVNTSRAKESPSIAVLPFANMSRDPDDEYFSDGLAEEILNLLAKIPDLKVTARTSSFAFRGKEQDITRIAETLRVKAILEGSVRRSGGRIRVTAQLINASDGYHLWSERYDRELADVFAVQDEIAAAIAGALKVALAPDTGLRRHQPSVAAWEAYLKGHHFQFKFTAESVARAKVSYEEAVALDPEFALARVGQSDYFLTLAAIGLMPAREAMPLVRKYAQLALEIDSSLAEAHAMLGIVAGVYDYEWEEARRCFDRAKALAPGPHRVRVLRSGFYLMWVGDPTEGVGEVRDALQTDPLKTLYRWNLAVALFASGRDSEAAVELRHILEIDENFWYASVHLALFHASQGGWAEAIAYARRARATVPFAPQVAGLLAGILKRMGEAAAADEIVSSLVPEDCMVPTGLAIFHYLCGDMDEAVQWIGKAIDQRDPQLVSLTCKGFGKALLGHPLWPQLAKRMRVPEIV